MGDGGDPPNSSWGQTHIWGLPTKVSFVLCKSRGFDGTSLSTIAHAVEMRKKDREICFLRDAVNLLLKSLVLSRISES